MSCFDERIDRRCTESVKWNLYDEDVLPMWVADMDFASPPPVIEALRERVSHGVFGYPNAPEELIEVVVERLQTRYNWQVDPSWIMFLPGCVTGFNLFARAITKPGDGVLVQTPVYGPIHHAPANHDLLLQSMLLTPGADGRYTVDFDLMQDTIDERTKLFLLCNPHNPVGRVFTRQELTDMAEICLAHDMYIASDEIHCELVLDGRQHTPIASISPDIAARTVTLMAPSKTFNLAGLQCSFAIVPDENLRKAMSKTRAGMVPDVNLMGYTAALAAYKYGDPWLEDLLIYLAENRDYASSFIEAEMPGVRMSPLEGTYLAWLDCREAGLGDRPDVFFCEQARVALTSGTFFGPGGEGFCRLCLGSPRQQVVEALKRMRDALTARNG